MNQTARDVTAGNCNITTGGNPATAGPDDATGHGLVDAHKAVMVAKLRCITITPDRVVDRRGIDDPRIRPHDPIIPRETPEVPHRLPDPRPSPIEPPTTGLEAASLEGRPCGQTMLSADDLAMLEKLVMESDDI